MSMSVSTPHATRAVYPRAPAGHWRTAEIGNSDDGAAPTIVLLPP